MVVEREAVSEYQEYWEGAELPYARRVLVVDRARVLLVGLDSP